MDAGEAGGAAGSAGRRGRARAGACRGGGGGGGRAPGRGAGLHRRLPRLRLAARVRRGVRQVPRVRVLGVRLAKSPVVSLWSSTPVPLPPSPFSLRERGVLFPPAAVSSA